MVKYDSVPLKPDGSASLSPPSICSASSGLGAVVGSLKSGTPRKRWL
jgi:hypothetical protein